MINAWYFLILAAVSLTGLVVASIIVARQRQELEHYKQEEEERMQQQGRLKPLWSALIAGLDDLQKLEVPTNTVDPSWVVGFVTRKPEAKLASGSVRLGFAHLKIPAKYLKRCHPQAIEKGFCQVYEDDSLWVSTSVMWRPSGKLLVRMPSVEEGLDRYAEAVQLTSNGWYMVRQQVQTFLDDHYPGWIDAAKEVANS
jgi:hypothetical protein